MSESRRRLTVVVLVMLAGLAATAATVALVAREHQRTDDRRFAADAARLRDDVTGEVRRYVDLLEAAGEFISVDDTLAPREFTAWGQRGLLTDYAGLRSVAFVSYVPPTASTPESYIVTAATPTPPAGVGADLGGSAERRDAFARARDTAQPALTGSFYLLADEAVTPGQRQLAFAIYVPIYRQGAPLNSVAERRAALIGFAATAMRGQQFLDAEGFGRDGVGFTLVDRDGRSLGVSSGRVTGSSGLRRTLTTTVGGRRWTLRAVTLDGFGRAGAGSVIATGAAGCALTVLIAFALHQQFTRRRTLRDAVATALARAAVAEDRFSAAFASAAIPSALLRPDGTIVEVNEAFCAQVGRRDTVLVGRTIDELVFDADREEVTRVLEAVAALPSVSRRLSVRLERDDTLRYVRATASGVAEEGGMLVLLQAEDVTAVVEKDRRLSRQTEARRLEQERKDRIFDTVQEGLVLLDADGRMLEWNPATEKMLGLSPEQLSGRSPYVGWTAIRADGTLMRPDELPSAIARRTRTPATNQLMGLPRPDGTVAWVEANARPILDREAGDEVLGVVVSFVDVSARQQLERDRVAAEARFRAAFESSAVGMALVRGDGTIVEANEAFATMTRHPIDAVIGRSVRSFRHPADLHIGADDLAALRRGECDHVAFEARFLRADEEVGWAHISISRIGDYSTDTAVVLQAEDVTERRLAEEALRAKEARFAALVERSTDVICLLDAEGRLTYASPAGERILGVGDGSHLGRTITELVHPDDLGRILETLRTLRASPGLTAAVEVRVQTVTGGWRHVEIVATNRLDDPDVHGIVANVRDVTDRAEAASRLSWQAFHDTLTGLPNRALLLDRLGHALERAKRNGGRTGLLFIDLDRFKAVNDTLGHRNGDELLIEVASRITRAVRTDDTVARLGGDEFVVLAESIHDPDEASAMALRVNKALADPIELPGGAVQITASIGVAFDVDHKPDSLLRDADDALYRAKARGKNRYEVFDDGLRAEALRRVSTEQVLRRALDDGPGLTVHYQPIVDLNSGLLVAAEALMRIPGPDGRLESPSEFIPIAEETGLIVAMGAGVLEDACRQLRSWRAELGDDAPRQVAVNVSARQLSAPGFVDLVRRTLDVHALAPADLSIEFTESTIISADHSTTRTVELLHELGATLAIDDFGTGYSSLAYLKRFPIDAVKLDRSFVDGLGTDTSDTEIVKAVISLGHSLGLVTVAEGIETPEQLAALRGLGCDCGQGFILARPVAPSELAAAVDRLRQPAWR